MVYILMSIILGAFITLLFVAPSEYYATLLILPLIGGVVVTIFKKYIKKPSKYIIISLPFILILSYLLTSFVAFKPKEINLVNVDKNKLSESKKSVILYSDGEMEKYIPYFAGRSIENTPYLMKPFESYKLKKAYDEVEISKKNMEIINISKEVNSTLLKNSPHYFYISYAKYTPSLKEAINASINDGCKSISILNLSNDSYAADTIISMKDNLNSLGINVNISSPILKHLPKEFVLKEVPSDISKFNGVLILDNNSLGRELAPTLKGMGINENSIVISSNIDEGISLLKNNISAENINILTINLLDFKNGIFEKYTLPNTLEKYDNIDFEIINPLKYDKDFLEIIINEYKKIKK